MKVCTTCNNYAAKCKCRNKKKNIVKIDEDLAPIIIGYNRAFEKLHLKKRTMFCCAGHIGKYHHNDYIPQVYIKFTDHFDFSISGFFNDIIKLRLPKYIIIDLDLDMVGIRSTKSLGRLSLERKIKFLKAKYIFINYLIRKLRQLENSHGISKRNGRI